LRSPLESARNQSGVRRITTEDASPARRVQRGELVRSHSARDERTEGFLVTLVVACLMIPALAPVLRGRRGLRWTRSHRRAEPGDPSGTSAVAIVGVRV
jgi:hypothetical protein